MKTYTDMQACGGSTNMHVTAGSRPRIVSAIRGAPGIMALTFLFSRAVMTWVGVTFDASGLGALYQYLDTEILSTRLTESLFFLHSQPPLFNLFLGLTMKMFPVHHEWMFHLLFMGFGFAVYVLIYSTLRLNGIQGLLAYLAATIFILSPSVILYERWLFYTWPVAAMLAAAARSLSKYERSRWSGYGVQFVFWLCLVCLTRSLFHIAFLVVCVGLVLLIKAPGRKHVIMASVVALTVLFALLAKNLLIFGFWGTSSWGGMSLWKIAGSGSDKIEELVANGRIPDTVCIAPFSHLSAYPEEYGRIPPNLARVPCLALAQKTTGERNLNHFGYVRLSREYMKAAKQIMRSDPVRYGKNVAKAWLTYAKPSWDCNVVRKNHSEIERYDDLVSLRRWRAELEKRILGLEPKLDIQLPFSSLLLVPLSLVVAGAGTISLLWSVAGKRPTAVQPIALVFMVLTVAYVALIGNSLEMGENNRFRMMTDPLLYIAVIVYTKNLHTVFVHRRIIVRN